ADAIQPADVVDAEIVPLQFVPTRSFPVSDPAQGRKGQLAYAGDIDLRKGGVRDSNEQRNGRSHEQNCRRRTNGASFVKNIAQNRPCSPRRGEPTGAETFVSAEVEIERKRLVVAPRVIASDPHLDNDDVGSGEALTPIAVGRVRRLDFQ